LEATHSVFRQWSAMLVRQTYVERTVMGTKGVQHPLHLLPAPVLWLGAIEACKKEVCVSHQQRLDRFGALLGKLLVEVLVTDRVGMTNQRNVAPRFLNELSRDSVQQRKHGRLRKALPTAEPGGKARGCVLLLGGYAWSTQHVPRINPRQVYIGAGWIGLGVRQIRQDIPFIEKQEL